MRLLVNVLLTLCKQNRLCKINAPNLPKLSRFLYQNQNESFSTITKNYNSRGTMSEFVPNDIFQGDLDRFNGVTVFSEAETCPLENFSSKLENSIKQWRNDGRRAIWFKVHLNQSDWVSVLAKKGFRFHHAKDDFVMMYLWLPITETCNVPPYAHTMIGVGAVVTNQSQILVVSEKYYQLPHWKLPGGYVEPGENLVDAAIREVFEETGVRTEFQSLINLRHGHHGMFDCSDIYFVIGLKPLTLEIEKCDREIAKCQWMEIDEYLNHPNVHELNRFFLQKYLEYAKKNIKIDWHHGIHQVLKKPYTVYFVTETNNQRQ